MLLHYDFLSILTLTIICKDPVSEGLDEQAFEGNAIQPTTDVHQEEKTSWEKTLEGNRDTINNVQSTSYHHQDINTRTSISNFYT